MTDTRQILARVQPETYDYIRSEAKRRHLSISRTAALMLARAVALGWEISPVGAVDAGTADKRMTGNGYPE